MTVTQQALFLAVLTQVTLTLILYVLLLRRRLSIQKDPAQIKPELAYDQSAWPLKARLASNALISQFELPVLFYVAVLFAFQFNATSWLAVILAWIFVASRVAHALVLTGANVVPLRGGVFAAGFVSLIVFWIALAVRVLSAGVQ